jgi:secreted trypsin-like serine protease
MKVQEGIVSYGEPICPRGYPVVFTLLQSYLDWIVENIPELD